jgi:tetratricopeptide (TPR) repeat protein
MRFISLLILAAIATPVFAQDKDSEVQSDSASATVKVAPVDPAKRAAQELDKLMGELQAEFPRDADGTSKKIWSIWMSNPSPTAELLLKQAMRAKNDGAYDSSEKILSTLIGDKPEFAEAYNKRAALYYTQQRYDEALADLDQVLELEPRHFGALAGKAMVHHAQGQFAQAVAALKDALAINPHDEAAKEVLKSIDNKTPGI